MMPSGASRFANLEPKYSVVTPAGVAIEYYFDAPKGKRATRGYLIRGPEEIEWREPVSVTAALECLDKPALPWWGMQIGVDAVIALVEMELLAVGFDGTKHGLYLPGPGGHLLTRDEVVEFISKNKLTVNHVKQEAGDRGQGVHDALEQWGVDGTLPDPSKFKFDDQGYVEGLRKFLLDAQYGNLEAEEIELAVASPIHGFAGRFDLLARSTDPFRVVTKVYPVNPPKHVIVPPGRYLIDLKTSKDIYPQHLLQLEAYAQGMIECGYGEVDAKAVLHVTRDGEYEFRQAKGTLEGYLAVLRTWHVLAETREALKI